jgi:hypothetical protein
MATGRTPQGHYEAQDWLTTPAAQSDVHAVNAVAERHREQLLGVTRDNGSRELLVVIDPGAGSESVDRLVSELDDLDLSLDVVIRSGCHGVDDLRQVQDSLDHTGDRDLVFAHALDPARGAVSVMTNDARFAETLSARYGDLVDVAVTDQLSRLIGGRDNDGIPHYGDADIGPCSSNFSFSHPMFYRVTATAGHCGNGTFYSGSNLVGSTLDRRFPNPDMQLLWSLYHDYTNRIYVDPCCPSVRTVIGQSTPGVNQFVCVGGAESLSQCGAEVINTNAQFCDSDGCTNNLTQVFRLGNPAIAIPGDSGGVVYQRSGSSGALASGLIVAGGGPVYGGWTEWHHTIPQIQATFGVTLVTSP